MTRVPVEAAGSTRSVMARRRPQEFRRVPEAIGVAASEESDRLAERGGAESVLVVDTGIELVTPSV